MASQSTPSERPEADAEPAEPASAPPSEDAEAGEAGRAGEEKAAAEPAKKPKKKRKKARGTTEPEADKPLGEQGPQAAGEDAEKAAEARRRRERRNNWIFAGVIVSAILLELWLFGKNGEVRICVGREGVTDFNLIGARRTDENRPRVPYCDTRYNIGLTGDLERRKEETLYLACRKATILAGEQERAMCFGGMADWKKHVTVRQVMPWEREFTRRMFWFLE